MSIGRTGKIVAGAAALAVLVGGGAVAYATGSWSLGGERPRAQSSVEPRAGASASSTPEHRTAARAGVPPTPAPVPSTPTPSAGLTPTKAPVNPVTTTKPKPEPEPKPAVLMGMEARSDRVRNLEARLVQLDLLTKTWVDGYFGTSTRTAVRAFQRRHGLDQLGYVDAKTWDRVKARTRRPTRAELYPPKPEPSKGGKLDARCLTGRAICIDKSSRTLRWVVDGEVRLTMDARFGCRSTPTREGVFRVNAKVRQGYSNMYESRMPFSMFFSRHQAVHYSDDFNARGYNGCSHGCVNIRNWNAISSLFDQARVGDRVVVYWS